jgi:GT2 family glycosyltransferase
MKNFRKLNSNDKPICSVCIANYNGIEYIDSCISSVINQTFLFNVEIIIHDDAPTDGSADYIQKNYPAVRLIESSMNVGFCVSNNRMAKEAAGDFLFFLNNDAILFPDALETLYNYSLHGNSHLILSLPQYNAETCELIDIGSKFDLFLNPVPNKDKMQARNIGMVIGACLWIPMPLWKDLGGFPEYFQSLAEDMYICCMARLRGFQVETTPYSGFHHWVGKSIGGGKILKDRLSTLIKRRALSERNKSYVMVICYPSPLFQLFFPIHIFLLFTEGLFLSIIKSKPDLLLSIYLFAIKSLWKKRYRLLRLREIHQKRKTIKPHVFLKPFNFIPYKFEMLIRYGMPEIK